MKLFEQLRLLERLDQLIRLKATGTPAQLARRLKVSKRSTYNLINILREFGAEISYCKSRCSYQYTKEIVFCFTLVIPDLESKKIKGEERVQLVNQK